jgi:hypothetical protein
MFTAFSAICPRQTGANGHEVALTLEGFHHKLVSQRRAW